MTEADLQRLTLSEALPDYSEIVEAARLDRSFNVSMLWPQCRQTTLKPMLQSAREATVFGVKPDSKYGSLLEGILTPGRGKHFLRLEQELVDGRDGLWTTQFTAWNSLVVLLPNRRELVEAILATCFGPHLVSNWRVGISRAALRVAMRAAETKDDVAFLMEGIEYLNVVAHPDVIAEYLDFVARTCRISKPDSWRYGGSASRQ